MRVLVKPSVVKRRLIWRGYEARLYPDPRAGAELFHYTVTQLGSSHILAWGQEYGEEAAEREAVECIRDLEYSAPRRRA